jgi:hypothetical protein
VVITRQKLENVLETLLFVHRLKRRWTTFQFPKRSGRSRQGIPARFRYSSRHFVRATCP